MLECLENTTQFEMGILSWQRREQITQSNRTTTDTSYFPMFAPLKKSKPTKPNATQNSTTTQRGFLIILTNTYSSSWVRWKGGGVERKRKGKEYFVDKFWIHLEVKLPLKSHRWILALGQGEGVDRGRGWTGRMGAGKNQTIFAKTQIFVALLTE